MAASTDVLINKFSIQEVTDDDSHWITRQGSQLNNDYIEMWYWGKITVANVAGYDSGADIYSATVNIDFPVNLSHIACIFGNITDRWMWANVAPISSSGIFSSADIRIFRNKSYSLSNTYTFYMYVFGEPSR